jgi:hypothetical protein
MSTKNRATRGVTTRPPEGFEVIRTAGRYFPVYLHLTNTAHPGATAFKRPDGSTVSFAKRTSAILYLYQHGHQLAV